MLQKVTEINIDEEKTALRKRWKDLTGTYPLPSYPEDFILDLELYERLILINYINDRYFANFVDYAKGEDLDRLASNYGVKRLPPLPAITVLRFFLNAPTLIPKGVRVATQSGVIFKTAEEKYGTDIVDVLAECETPGEIGNGFSPGEIKILLDDVEGIEKVENKTISTGGSNEEDDEHLRRRIKLALDKPTAGSREHYEFLIYSLRPDIVNVKVHRKAPGHVIVYFILKGGELPTEDLIRKAIEVVNDDRNKPLTDFVEVKVPEPVYVNVKLKVYVESPPPDIETILRNSIESHREKLKTSIGESLYISKLMEVAHAHPAIKRVQVMEPSGDVIVSTNQVINIQTIEVDIENV